MTTTPQTTLRHLWARLTTAIRNEIAAACGHTFPELDHQTSRDQEGTETRDERGAA